MSPGPDPFTTTRWTLVSRARGDDEVGRLALEELCTLYWPPVFAYFRGRGLSIEEASDRTQGLFGDLLARGDLLRAQPAVGKFRAWLLACAKNFDAKEHARANAEKRGGGRAPFSLDFESEQRAFPIDPAHGATPEEEFERRWARGVLDRALAALEAEHEARGRAELFRALQKVLEGELDESYAAIGGRLGLSEGAVKVAAHRMRVRLRDLLLAEVCHTVEQPEEAATELRALAEALGGNSG